MIVNWAAKYNASLNSAVTKRNFVLESRELDVVNAMLNTTGMDSGDPNNPLDAIHNLYSKV